MNSQSSHNKTPQLGTKEENISAFGYKPCKINNHNYFNETIQVNCNSQQHQNCSQHKIFFQIHYSTKYSCSNFSKSSSVNAVFSLFFFFCLGGTALSNSWRVVSLSNWILHTLRNKFSFFKFALALLFCFLRKSFMVTFLVVFSKCTVSTGKREKSEVRSENKLEIYAPFWPRCIFSISWCWWGMFKVGVLVFLAFFLAANQTKHCNCSWIWRLCVTWRCM